ncbi:hypothetical protein [Bradyrhizobium sp. LB11.1]|uniref:esterase/lipase family protein n=1 Tax=Bradyrhizobium sp. LB11.1 TaxID=3156326 RepID=UPI003398D68C
MTKKAKTEVDNYTDMFLALAVLISLRLLHMKWISRSLASGSKTRPEATSRPRALTHTNPDGSVRETVIIVHGTFAAPEPGNIPWYHPGDASAPEGFISKLDFALQRKGSQAKCWAHCPSDTIFQWSGDNSWIARTQAASELAEYVGKLHARGWRCHIVAHSHGGNVLRQALPNIIVSLGPNQTLGKFVTIGTPFIDTSSPMRERVQRATNNSIEIGQASWRALCLLAAILTAPVGLFVLLILVIISRGIRQTKKPSSGSLDAFWAQSGQVGSFLNSITTTGGILLALGSPKDEAWQILHHIRSLEDPIAVKTGIFKYIISSLGGRISLSENLARIGGAKSFFDLPAAEKPIFFCVHAVFGFLLAVVCGFVVFPEFSLKDPSVLLIIGGSIGLIPLVAAAATALFGHHFHSSLWSPLRWCWYRVSCLKIIPRQMLTYGIRRSAWAVLQAMTMGLEGYQLRLPAVEREPPLRSDLWLYEDIPKAVEERALARRGDWIRHNLSVISETFSSAVITQDDLNLLLRQIEADQSLVHAAYYTDGECIARIADWIAR